MGIAGVRWLVLSSLGTLLQLGPAHAQPAPPAGAPPPGQEWVRVTLPQIGKGAHLEVFEGGKDKDPDDDEGWRILCVEPCTMWMPSGTHLRVSGNFRRTDPFALPRSPTGIYLQVKPSAADAKGLGIAIAAISAPFMTIGAIFYSKEWRTSGSGSGFGRGAVALLGLVGVGFGVTLVALSTSSKVTPLAGPAAQPKPAAPSISLGRGLSLGPDGIHF